MTPNPPPPAPTQPDGYLASTLGGLLIGLPIGGAGAAIGIIPMQLLYDREAGLANIALLIFPAVLGAIASIVGMYVGVRFALRWRQHPRSHETAQTGALLTLVALLLAPATGGVSALSVLAIPAAARWLATRQAPPPLPPNST